MPRHPLNFMKLKRRSIRISLNDWEWPPFRICKFIAINNAWHRTGRNRPPDLNPLFTIPFKTFCKCLPVTGSHFWQPLPDPLMRQPHDFNPCGPSPNKTNHWHPCQINKKKRSAHPRVTILLNPTWLYLSFCLISKQRQRGCWPTFSGPGIFHQSNNCFRPKRTSSSTWRKFWQRHTNPSLCFAIESAIHNHTHTCRAQTKHTSKCNDKKTARLFHNIYFKTKITCVSHETEEDSPLRDRDRNRCLIALGSIPPPKGCSPCFVRLIFCQPTLLHKLPFMTALSDGRNQSNQGETRSHPLTTLLHCFWQEKPPSPKTL